MTRLTLVGTLAATAAAALTCSLGTMASAAPLADDPVSRGAGATASARTTTAELVVQFTGATSSSSRERAVNAEARAMGLRLTEVRTLGVGAQLFRADRPMSVGQQDALIQRLNARSDVAYAEPQLRMTVQSTPTDPDYAKQWHYYEATAGARVDTAWDLGVDGTGVKVAVLDTGSTPHPDIAWTGGYDFVSDATAARDGGGRDSDANDEGDWYAAGECGQSRASNSSWHGTHVAGTVAARSGNATGGTGVAPAASVVPIRVLGKCGGSSTDIADAIVWASGGAVAGLPANPNPAKVVNMSLGGSYPTCPSVYQNAINSARSRGTSVVVAAGNSGQDVRGATPANCSGVITVAASDRDGNRAWYSNYGSRVEITAPGGETSAAYTSSVTNGVYSTLNSGTTTQSSASYAYYQGTSMATPHIAGIVALVLDKNPNLTPDQVTSTLQSTARAFAGSCSGCGAGLVDAQAAVAATP